MRKIINMSFAAGLAIWFSTAIYLSVNSIIDIFVSTDPYIAKAIFGISFIVTAGIGTYNKIKGGNFTQIGQDLQRMKKERKEKISTGCKTCGKNKLKK